MCALLLPQKSWFYTDVTADGNATGTTDVELEQKQHGNHEVEEDEDEEDQCKQPLLVTQREEQGLQGREVDFIF